MRDPVLALDFGGTHLRTAVVLPDGSLVGHNRDQTPLAEGASAVIASARDSLIGSLTEHLAAGGTAPVAVGVSAPGPLDPSRGVLIDPPNLGRDFWGLPFAGLLADAIGLPVTLERDTHVAVLSEHAFGAGVGFDDVVYLTISTGIGGGVISGGRLLTGPDGVAGELGHLTVDMDGPVCGCGGRGHLERVTSGTGMAQSAHDALDAGRDAPELARLADAIRPGRLTGRDVERAAERGDAVAIEIVQRARRAFAAAVVSIVDIFNPDRVIVGGGIAMAWGDALLEPARQLVSATAFRVQARRVQIVAASQADDVGLVGALPLVALAWQTAGGPAHVLKPYEPTLIVPGAGPRGDDAGQHHATIANSPREEQ